MTPAAALPAAAPSVRGPEPSAPRAPGASGRAADFAALLEGALAAAPPTAEPSGEVADGAERADTAHKQADAPTTADAGAPVAPPSPTATATADAPPRDGPPRAALPALSSTAADGTDTAGDVQAEAPQRRTAPNAQTMAGRLRDVPASTAPTAPDTASTAATSTDEAPRAAAAALVPAGGSRSTDATVLAAASRPAAMPLPETAAAAVAAASVVDTQASAASAAPAPLPEARLPHPLASPAFAPALGQQVALWVRQGVPQALLQLNPAELGPVAVRIAVDGTQAHVDFTALHAATRSALEASLPALASALRDSGLTLAGGGVFDRPREQRDDGRGSDTPSARAGGIATVTGTDDAARPAPMRRGLVDLVA